MISGTPGILQQFQWAGQLPCYPQQLSAPNSFAYGAHTGYVNYQQQWRQLPPTLELPIIGASWQHPPPPGSGAASANNS